MNEDQDFTQGSIPKKLSHFMLPILGALVLQSMYTSVDLAIVGHFGTTVGVSGVSTGSNIIFLITVLVSSLTIGITVVIGRYIGTGKPQNVGRLIGNSVCFFLALSVVLTVTCFILARPIAILMQAPEEAIDATVSYIRINSVGFVFVVFYNYISSIFRGIGNSKLPLLFVGIACVVNIIGDLVLVGIYRMDVKGAAIATVSAQAVSVLLSLVIAKRQQLPFRIRREYIRFGNEIPLFLKIGLPLVLQDCLTNVTFLVICAFINRLGLDASSGYGIAQRIQGFVMLIPSALIQCMAPFVAQNVGAGKENRARSAMKYGMLIGASIGVIVALLTFFKGDMLASVFDDDAQVILKASEYLKGFAPEAVVTSILFSFLGYFNGHSRSLFVMLQGLIQSFLVRLPISYFMTTYYGSSLTGIGLAAPCATVVGIVICFIYYTHVKKRSLCKTPAKVTSSYIS